MLNSAHLARVDLNLLVLFQAVLEERNVARAAGRLILTPSAVSHGLARLRRLLNDPLFLRTPKGVVPTARALELADPVAEILARIGSVVASAAPFDPETSRRRFTIGAPDGISAVFLTPLLDRLARTAPHIDISLRQVLPELRGRPVDQAWLPSLGYLESRDADLVVLPVAAVPPRFVAHRLFEDDFLVAMRRGHPFASRPTLAQFCRMSHLLTSLSGDAHGFVDMMLARQGLSRRVALTVPSFMMALAHIAETDLLATLPRRLVERYAARFAVVTAELPLPRKPDPISVVTTRAAMLDTGVAWLVDSLIASCTAHNKVTDRSRRSTSGSTRNSKPSGKAAIR